MLWILKAQFVGNFADRFVRVKDLAFCYIYQFGLNIFLGGTPCFLFDQIPKVYLQRIKDKPQNRYYWYEHP